MYEALSAAMASYGVIKDLAHAIVQERDRVKAAAIQIDLTNHIIDGQSKLSQVLGSIVEKDALIQTLTQRIAELDRSQAQRARYQLAKLGTVGDFFAYQLRPSVELVENTDEIPHFLCQPCFDAGKKSVLVVSKYNAFCQLCKSKVQLASMVIQPHVSGRTGRDW